MATNEERRGRNREANAAQGLSFDLVLNLLYATALLYAVVQLVLIVAALADLTSFDFYTSYKNYKILVAALSLGFVFSALGLPCFAAMPFIKGDLPKLILTGIQISALLMLVLMLIIARLNVTVVGSFELYKEIEYVMLSEFAALFVLFCVNVYHCYRYKLVAAFEASLAWTRKICQRIASRLKREQKQTEVLKPDRITPAPRPFTFEEFDDEYSDSYSNVIVDKSAENGIYYDDTYDGGNVF